MQTQAMMIGVLIGLGILILVGAALRDKKVEQWADRYEECVAREYHTTPAEYRYQNGEYPACQK